MHIPGFPFRKPRFQTVRLPDGRNLAYAEFGDPAGKPIFLFHGCPGSRLQRHPDDTIDHALGARVITVDRPGFGHSDPKPGRRLLDWPDDVEALANHLEIEKFALGGWSGGGPYVAACAKRIPRRLTKVMLVSSIAPMWGTNLVAKTEVFFRTVFTLAKRAPWALEAMVSRVHGWVERNPEAFVNHVASTSPPGEREIFKHPDLRKFFVQIILDGGRQGRHGPPTELRLVARDWGFKLEEIEMPIHVWHGERDRTVPRAMADYLVERLPNSQPRFFPHEGHFMTFTKWQEIVQTLVA